MTARPVQAKTGAKSAKSQPTISSNNVTKPGATERMQSRAEHEQRRENEVNVVRLVETRDAANWGRKGVGYWILVCMATRKARGTNVEMSAAGRQVTRTRENRCTVRDRE